MKVLYCAPTGEIGWIDEPRLAPLSERHKILVNEPALQRGTDALTALDREPGSAGVIVVLFTGRVGRPELKLVGRVLSRGKRAWLYWPADPDC